MMYRLTPNFKHLTEEQQHDLWIMIKALQDAPLPATSWQRQTGDEMMKKYFEEDKKD